MAAWHLVLKLGEAPGSGDEATCKCKMAPERVRLALIGKLPNNLLTFRKQYYYAPITILCIHVTSARNNCEIASIIIM